MKFIVTGGGGFIGSHVVDLLVQNDFDVCVVDNFSTGLVSNLNPKSKLVRSSCANFPPKLLHREATVIHLAAQPMCNVSLFLPERDAVNNYLVGLKFLTRCLNAQVQRFVFVSSMSVYGDAGPLPYREEMVVLPRDPYAIHKWAFERISLIEGLAHDVEIVIVRPQHVFGPRQRPDFAHRNVIARWIRRALLWQPLPIIGSLNLCRAFSPVSLVARGIVAAATIKEASGETFNLGTHRVRTLREIADVLACRLAIPLKMLELPSPPTLLKHSYGAVDKAERVLGVYEGTDEFDRNLNELIKEISIGLDDKKEEVLEPELMEGSFWQTYRQSS